MEEVERMLNREYSFAPLVDASSDTLILGSLPGVESLRRQQYYAHPRNAFWNIIYKIFGDEPDGDYRRRCGYILSKNIALWDVCGSAERIGAADSKLKNIVPNNISGLLDDYPGIKKIILNGRKAENEYRKHFGSLPIPAFYAPSTSPALAALTFDAKLAAWQKAINTGRQIYKSSL
jgi:hypoxanthine-DNA glycosylase